MSAQLVIFIGGVAAFLATLYILGGQELRQKYAMAWMGIALVLLLCGISPGLLDSIARYTNISPEAIMLLVAMALLYAFSYSLSISQTRQSRLTQRLTQELAFLERRCRLLEAAQTKEARIEVM